MKVGMIIVNERNVNVIDCNGKYQGSVGYDKIGEYFFRGYKVRVHNPFIKKLPKNTEKHYKISLAV